MRFRSPYALLCATIGAGLLAGCSGGSSTTGSSPVPNNMAAQSSKHVFNQFRAPIPLEKPPIRVGAWARPSWYREAPDAEVTRGIYVSQFFGTDVLGYKPKANKANVPPICSEYATSVNDVATDSKANLIVPDGGAAQVEVYQGPNLCGPAASPASFPDSDGQPSGATTKNALTDTIYVANILFASQTYGGVSVCTLAGGCTSTLSNPAVNDYAYSVKLDKAGNLYFAGRVLVATSQYSAALILFKNGQGAGEVVPGYVNAYPGGLDMDNQGNLLAIDAHANGVGALYIYTGCPDNCTANGPWPLQAESVFGKLNRQNDRYYVGDFINGTVDVYKYTGPKGGISYLYSFNNSLTVSGDVHGIALNRPSSP